MPRTEEQEASGKGKKEGPAHELYRRAKRLSDAGAVEEAVAVYRELLAIEPAHLRARNNLGVLYDSVGDYRRALAEYQAAEELDPDDVRLQCNIAAVLASLGRYREAEAKLMQALATDPQNPDARENLGLVYFKKGLYAEAAVELRRAAELEAERASAFFYLGEALNHLNDIDAAMEALQRSVEIKPAPRAYYTMGILYDRMKRPDLAQAMYRKAEELGGW